MRVASLSSTRTLQLNADGCLSPAPAPPLVCFLSRCNCCVERKEGLPPSAVAAPLCTVKEASASKAAARPIATVAKDATCEQYCRTEMCTRMPSARTTFAWRCVFFLLSLFLFSALSLFHRKTKREEKMVRLSALLDEWDHLASFSSSPVKGFWAVSQQLHRLYFLFLWSGQQVRMGYALAKHTHTPDVVYVVVALHSVLLCSFD